MNDGFQVEFFCGHQGEAGVEIEPHLVAENRPCAGSSAVSFLDTVIENMLYQGEVLFHVELLWRWCRVILPDLNVIAGGIIKL